MEDGRLEVIEAYSERAIFQLIRYPRKLLPRMASLSRQLALALRRLLKPAVMQWGM